MVNPATGEILPAYCAPRTSRAFEEFRVLKIANDLKYRLDDCSPFQRLRRSERKKVATVLMRERWTTFANARKALGLPKGAKLEPETRDRFGGDFDKKKGIKGNQIEGWLRGLGSDDLLKALWDNPARFLTDEARKEFSASNRLGTHILRDLVLRHLSQANLPRRKTRSGRELPTAKYERCVTLLQDDFVIPAVDAIRLVDAPFPDGASNLSFEALAKLLPHMRNGLSEYEARVKAFGGDLAEETVNLQRSIEEPPRRTDFPNPRVRKGLKEMRLVINEYLAQNPNVQFDEVRIEFARRNRMSDAELKDFVNYENYAQRMRSEAQAFLQLRGRTDVEDFARKYRLWHEQGGTDPYEDHPSTPISQEELLAPNAVQVDHIWGREYGDGWGDVVLTRTHNNAKKSNRKPWEYDESWRKKRADIAHSWPILTKPKTKSAKGSAKEDAKPKVNPIAVSMAKARLAKLVQAEKPAEDKLHDRHLHDTAAMARAAAAYLAPIARKVTPVRASFTTGIAKSFGLYKILNASHSEDLKLLSKEVKGKKERVLLKQHAVDATAAAIASPALQSALFKLRQSEPDRRRLREAILQKACPKNLQDNLRAALQELQPSHEQPDIAPHGELHEAIAWGIRLREAMNKRPTITKSIAIVDAGKCVDLGLKGGSEDADDAEASDKKAGKNLTVKSPLTKQRLLDYFHRKNITTADGLKKALLELPYGIPYESKSGRTRYIRRFRVVQQMDEAKAGTKWQKPMAQGGYSVFNKGENFGAFLYARGSKRELSRISLFDAAKLYRTSDSDFVTTLRRFVAQRDDISLECLENVPLLQKGTLVRRKDSEDKTIYKLKGIESKGRLFLVASHLSEGPTKTIKGISFYQYVNALPEFEVVRISPTGKDKGL